MSFVSQEYTRLWSWRLYSLGCPYVGYVSPSIVITVGSQVESLETHSSSCLLPGHAFCGGYWLLVNLAGPQSVQLWTRVLDLVLACWWVGWFPDMASHGVGMSQSWCCSSGEWGQSPGYPGASNVSPVSRVGSWVLWLFGPGSPELM